MKLIIDVDKEEYDILMLWKDNPTGLSWAQRRIIEGVPLPKGCDIQRIIPKRVDVQKWIYTECPNPNCDYELSTHYGDGYYFIEHKPNFCPNCGQALDWGDSDDELDKEI